MSDSRDAAERIFWAPDCPHGQALSSGLFFRTMGLGRFIEECEQKGCHIVGIRVDGSNNGELICVPSEEGDEGVN